MDNKFKEGDIVYSKKDPEIKLTIRRFVDRIYYCRVQNDSSKKDRVYFENELIPIAPDHDVNH